MPATERCVNCLHVYVSRTAEVISTKKKISSEEGGDEYKAARGNEEKKKIRQ